MFVRSENQNGGRRMRVPILIVGAGPTGLNLALSLAYRRVPFRIMSDGIGPGEHSRAMVVQARTLEFYAQFGFADEVIAQGVIANAVHIRAGQDDESVHERTTISFRDLGDGISPYPFALAYPQDDHERFLVGKLKDRGIDIEWRSKLTGLVEEGDRLRATVSCDGRVEETLFEYVCGCDGAHSRVRESLNIGFPGGTYDQQFFVADVRIARGFDRDLYINLGKHILTLMFPVRSSGMQRLIGLFPPELADRNDFAFDDIRPRVERQLNVTVADVNWFSAYRVHHRVAERFRVGRAFLLGDAGHIHSPVGGQGMNTGIGDAINLGWKLAHVIQELADPALLDTYEPERIGFARSLVATTDRAFTPLVAEGISGDVVRRIIAPLIFSVAVRFAPTRHAIFRLISQARIHYPDSPLSSGQAGHVHGGDRLPWTGPDENDNFAPLRSLDWQLHVYGNLAEDLSSVAREAGLAIHTFRWGDKARDAGFQKDAAYLVRPDGYVAAALEDQSVPTLKAPIERFGIRFRPKVHVE
jgi:2-polyprenyl-6-methoxyphenol hydroxylase-like FAD-dependent oxidoreductase